MLPLEHRVMHPEVFSPRIAFELMDYRPHFERCSIRTFLPIETQEGLHYLRPETAQGIFVNFLNVQSHLEEAAVRHRADRQGVPQRDHRATSSSAPANSSRWRWSSSSSRLLPGSAPASDSYPAAVVCRPGHRSENLRLLEHPAEKLWNWMIVAERKTKSDSGSASPLHDTEDMCAEA